MRVKNACIGLAFFLTCSYGPLVAQSHPQVCPVSVDRIELSYNHEGGQSKPQIRIRFGNAGLKDIAKVVFNLSILDPGGYARPYSPDPTYTGVLEAGKKKLVHWNLATEQVDIHRTGERVFVQAIEFADSTKWTDDGSESCELKVDFHPQ